MTIDLTVRRLTIGDVLPARRLFLMMAEVFGEAAVPLPDAYIEALLANPGFWAMAAFSADEVVGGITAHTIALTHRPDSALFVYDVAVRSDFQRRGVGRRLVDELRAEASRQEIDSVFVLADDEDAHALDFYRSVGATASAVTMFELGP